MVAVATRETRRPDTTALRVLSAVVVLCLGAVVFTLWNSLGGKLDSEVSSEDLREIDSTFYTTFEDPSNVVEYFHQSQMQAGTYYSLYVKDVGSCQDFLDGYTTLSDYTVYTDSQTVERDLYYLDSYFKYTEDRDLSLDTFSPHTFVEAPTGEDGYDDVRVWFFTEGDGSQSAIVNVVYGG
jgi:hypothetical protein